MRSQSPTSEVACLPPCRIMPVQTSSSRSSAAAAARTDMSVILVTGSYDHEIRFWEAWSGICSRTIPRAAESGVSTFAVCTSTSHSPSLPPCALTASEPLSDISGVSGWLAHLLFICRSTRRPLANGYWPLLSTRRRTYTRLPLHHQRDRCVFSLALLHALPAHRDDEHARRSRYSRVTTATSPQSASTARASGWSPGVRTAP